MNKKLDIVTIRGKQIVFIDELSFGYPLDIGETERAVPPLHVPCHCSFILRVERETEEIIRGIQDARNYLERNNP